MAWTKNDNQASGDMPLSQRDLDWFTVEERALFYGELRGYAKARGWKPGWAAVKFKQRFGYAPSAEISATPVLAPTDFSLPWIEAVMRDAWRQAKKPR